MLLAGDHGGRGTGLAGGYSGHQSSRQPPSTVPDLELAGAGDDPYAGYDPGMAGCTAEVSTCHIPGILWMGASPPESPTHPRPHAHVRAVSRGYERDEDEYAASFTSQTGSTEGLGVTEPGSSQTPAQGTVPGAEPTSSTDAPPAPAAEYAHPPPFGTRLVGRVERLAGKVLRDPEIQARGKRHMVRCAPL